MHPFVRSIQLISLWLQPKQLDTKEKVIVFYRYFSWLMTSCFYLMQSQDNALRYKAVVVLALLVFSRTVLDYYLRDANAKTIQIPILVETICLTFLLVPTGGLESPFVWYALNPILMACTYLKSFYCWFNLWVYLTASTLVSYKLFNGQDLTLLQLIRDKSYIILVYILVTGVVMLLVCLVKKLDEKNETLNRQGQELRIMNDKLQEANVSVKRAMEHVMSLYHIIETFTLHEGKQNVLRQMVDSATKITESKGAFLWLFSHKDEPSKFIENISPPSLKESLLAYLKGVEATLIQEPFFNIEVEQLTFRATRIQSSSRFYGFIGIELASSENDCSVFIKDELLDFLSKLVSLFLERQDFKELSSKLIIMEEQNRIANEIHDSVSQRLFSIVCGLHALNLNWHTLDKDTLTKQKWLISLSRNRLRKLRLCPTPLIKVG